MKCTNCGYENQQYFECCPYCGRPTQADVVSLNPAGDKILCALKNKLFLVICILSSVSCLLSFNGGLPVMNILFTIFLWLTFASSCKDNADHRYLRCLSGTVYANYIIIYVALGLFLITGIFLSTIVSAISANPALMEEFALELTAEEQALMYVLKDILTASGWVVMLIVIVIVAVGLIINILGVRKIHRFAQSIYQSVDMCTLNIRYARAAKNWLLVFGIFTAISAVNNLFNDQTIGCIISSCDALMAIFASVLISKHLVSVDEF